jgi:hypothetical protein
MSPKGRIQAFKVKPSSEDAVQASAQLTVSPQLVSLFLFSSSAVAGIVARPGTGDGYACCRYHITLLGPYLSS